MPASQASSESSSTAEASSSAHIRRSSMELARKSARKSMADHLEVIHEGGAPGVVSMRCHLSCDQCMIVTAEAHEGLSRRRYDGRTFFCLSTRNPIRRFFIDTVENVWFDRLVLLLIIANCVTMAAKDPLGEREFAWYSTVEWIFTGLFTAEMLAKMFAMGATPLESTTCYLSEGWNCLDGTIVAVSWVSQSLTDGSLSSLRTFRVLRPLRTISRIPGMRLIVRSMLSSLPQLVDVLLLFSFFLLAFAIVGVELFSGRLHYRCFKADEGLAGEPGDVCTCRNATSVAELSSGLAGCSDYCPFGEQCLYTPTNPNSGASGFDHVFDAMASIFQSVSLEGWSDLLHQFSVSQPEASPIYFILVVVFGAFFVMNLYVVVMSDSYMSTRENLAVEASHAALARSDAIKIARARKIKTREREHRKPSKRERAAAEVRHLGHVVHESIVGAASSAVACLKRRLPGVPRLRHLVDHRRFDFSMMLLIGLNTVALAIEFRGTAATPAYEQVLQACNYAFTLIFLLEMVLRVTAYGPVGYCRDSMNLFDAVIVIISLVELGLTITSQAGGDEAGFNMTGLRALRLFRALKAFKLARSYAGLRTLLKTVLYSLTQARDLAFLMLLAIFVFALLGMELFAGQMGSCSGEPLPLSALALLNNATAGVGTRRDLCLASGLEWTADHESFDDLGSAVVTILVVFIGENWNSVWHAAFTSSGWMATAYFVAALIAGNFMILNLLLGIILGSFSTANDEADGNLQADFARRKIAALKRLVDMKRTPGALQSFAEATRARVAADVVAHATAPPSQLTSQTAALGAALDAKSPRGAGSAAGASAGVGGTYACAGTPAGFSSTRVEGLPPLEEPSHPLERLRGQLRAVLDSSCFEWFVLILIVLSCACLALDNPRTPRDTPLNRTLFVCDFVFCILFTLEAIAKIAAAGLVGRRGGGGYLRDGWNVLDLLVVVISWTTIILTFANITSGSVRAMRALRALRPLRLVHHIPSMRMVVASILEALPGCATVASILLFFLLVFAILGMQFFGGAFGQCDDPLVRTMAECHAAGKMWYNPDIGHLDNALAAMILLFEMMTTEMWPDMLHAMTDAVGPGLAPRPNNSLWMGRLFCIVWMFVGALFVAQLFVGVLIDNFERLSDDARGKGELNHEQMSWLAVRKSVVALRAHQRPPKPPAHHVWRARAHEIALSAWFERSVAVLTVLNVMVLGASHYGEPEWLSWTLTIANFAFIALWAAESALKLFAFGCTTYFSFNWNRFDFTLVLCGLVEILIFSVAPPGSPLAASPGLSALGGVMRLARLARLLRVVQAIPALSSLLQTLLNSLPSLAAVVGLMVLVYFIYGLLGLQLFYNVVHGDFVNDNVNFESLPKAMLTLLAAATGESWNGIMHDLMVRPNGTDWLVDATGGVPRRPACALDPQIGAADCGSWLAVPFFITFELLSFCLLINAAIAVLLAHFTADEEEEFVPMKTLEQFAHEWSRFDPTATGLVPAVALPVILRHVDAPLGVRDNVKRYALLRLLSSLSEAPHKVPVHVGGTVQFHEVLHELAGRHFPSSRPGALSESRFANHHDAEIRSAMKKSLAASLRHIDDSAENRAYLSAREHSARDGEGGHGNAPAPAPAPAPLPPPAAPPAAGGAPLGASSVGLSSNREGSSRGGATRLVSRGGNATAASFKRYISEFTIVDEYAALMLQAAFKGLVTRKMLQSATSLSSPHKLPGSAQQEPRPHGAAVVPRVAAPSAAKRSPSPTIKSSPKAKSSPKKVSLSPMVTQQV